MYDANLAREMLDEYCNGTRSEVDGIIAYEGGEASNEGIVALFAHLVRTGRVWNLQGTYGRTARNLIDAGIISSTGEILEANE